MPLTHEAFDQLPKRPVLEHLRLTLVAVGALPERDEELVHLEQALTDFLAQQQDLNRRRILRRYLTGDWASYAADVSNRSRPHRG
ncbi:hypothetical protein [Micromonospora sp. SL4-19]|uniref:hypothetical protein n=1 Tax=Micromonospora sp. SL4-19 TaxID=3399129 RepID=UPI003A4E4A61